MPVTAKLSRKFYEKLGDEVTNELVDWLNTVDQSYRQEFRELFEAHFGRLSAEMRALEERLSGRMNGVQGKMKQLEERLCGRMNVLDGEMKQLEERLGGRMNGVQGEMKQLEERLRGEIKAQKSALVGWMLLFWLATVGATRLLG